MVTDSDAQKRAAQRILPLVDLTSLGDADEPADVDRLCGQAVTPFGSVASVCIWPRFVAQAASALEGTDVQTCAVANFPAGDDDPELAVSDASAIVEAGGHEVDVVIPWRSLADGALGSVERLVGAVRSEIGAEVVLKAILETGELADSDLITTAALESLAGGADFLKTSTGKTEHSATPEAVETLVGVLKDHGTTAGGPGIKVSGGVSTVADASVYLGLVDSGFGADWVGPRTMRFGASRLLDDLLRALKG